MLADPTFFDQPRSRRKTYGTFDRQKDMVLPVLIQLASHLSENLPPKSNLSEPKIELSLKLDRTSFRIGENPGIRIEMQNNGNETVRLIKVLDGSMWHWVNPKVGWSLMPIDREPMPAETPKVTTPRCGNMNPLGLDSFFELKKGEKTELDLAWTFPLLEAKPGEYRMAFYYEITAKDLPRKTLQHEAEGAAEKYQQLTNLRVRSNVVRIKIYP